MRELPEGDAEVGNRRELLIRTAGRLFREKGFDATTVRDLAGAVGMRSGSPFYHFRSKQELLATVMVAGLEHACATVSAVMAAEADDETRFRRMVHAHLDVILAPDSDFSVLLSEWRSLTPESRGAVIAVKDRYERLWLPVLESLVASRRLRAAKGLEKLFVFGVLNWSVQWYQPSGPLTLSEVATAAADFMLAPGKATTSG